jgi:hypothetical protein
MRHLLFLFFKSGANLRSLVYRPSTLHFESPRLHWERPRPSKAPFRASTTLGFNFDANPDPAFDFDSDLDPASENEADPNTVL